jgi:hypothetical protein
MRRTKCQFGAEKKRKKGRLDAATQSQKLLKSYMGSTMTQEKN